VGGTSQTKNLERKKGGIASVGRKGEGGRKKNENQFLQKREGNREKVDSREKWKIVSLAFWKKRVEKEGGQTHGERDPKFGGLRTKEKPLEKKIPRCTLKRRS